ncbi:uncharacterized protein LOC122084874 [Macadamia integrifolia]|uniref:uncharacterized protein LOC122084874 n=1 Tax=Macadamia integrifolia TaxID=60698 RepID=UPI001C4EDF32|nr:uncharacterized protein LOC122084874 [Macadamia integrifolia]
MVGFRRSLSFSTPSPRRPTLAEKSYHVRSISLPCKSHPLLSQLKDKIDDLRRWESELNAATTTTTTTTGVSTSACLCDGLTHLKNLQHCLDDLLHLPQTQESLRRRSDWVENLLEDFLRFVDVYGIFRIALLALKEQQLTAQVAIRRRDESKMVSYVKACNRKDKDMRKLASVVRCIGKWSAPAMSSDSDAELAAILRDVTQVTVSVSVALFNGISSSSSSSAPGSWMMTGWRLSRKTQKIKKQKGIREFEEAEVQSLQLLRKKGDEEVMRMTLRRLQALDDCIGGIESGTEKVFRSLINTRVSLLNVLTQY